MLKPGGSLDFLSGHNYATNAVAAMPIPAALPLFASGLGGFAYLARRRKRKIAAA